MAISDAVKAKLNKMNRAAQDAELGSVVQDLQNATTPEITDLIVDVGTVDNLNTTATDLTSAVNEVKVTADDAAEDIGDITTLNTTDKTDVVSAVNEINAKFVAGSYVADGDDETAGAIVINSGLSSITGFVLSVIRAGTQVGGGWTPTVSGGDLTITDAAIVATDIVHYIIF